MNANRPALKPATSADVARLAGVSRSTVSNVLNGNDARFPPATRAKVVDAAAKLKYRPSLAGRSLVTGRSDTIVILVPDATSYGSNLQDAVDGAVAQASRYSANVVVRFASESPRSTVEAIASLRPMAVLAFGGITDSDRETLEASGSIVVPGKRHQDTLPPHRIDGGVAELQAEMLLERGPRRLWYAAISDRRRDEYGPARFAALQNYCAKHGLTAPRRIVVSLTQAEGIMALREILAAGVPAGVACYNDEVALSLLAGAREVGVQVPEEVSVVGVDATVVGQLWRPRLSTIDTDLGGLAAAYAAELEARLTGSETSAIVGFRPRTLPGETT